MTDLGALALLPVAVVLIVSVATRRTLLALLCGTIVGAALLGGWNAVDVWVAFVGRSLANETTQWLLLIVALFGILITLFERSGIVRDFASWTERFVTTRRRSTVLSFVLAVVLFVDDYLNVLTVGASMQGVTDRYRVPRTELGTIMKLTAAPIAVIVPFSTWALFFSGLFEADGVTAGGSGFGAYLQAIPYVFFGWLGVLLAFLLAMGWLPRWGAIKRDGLRAAASGDVFPAGTVAPADGTVAAGAVGGAATAEGDETSVDESRAVIATEAPPRPTHRPQPWPFLVAMLVLVGVTIATEANIVQGTIAALAVTIVITLVQRRLGIRRLLDAALDGLGSMLAIFVLVLLAFMLQEQNVDLGLASLVIDAVEPLLAPALLPALVFVVCGVYAYATGSFWDLAAVVTPVVLPLAIAVGADPIVAGAAVFSGAALGSTTCLYGDGIILASKSIGITPFQLMVAILPYAAIGFAASALLYLVVGFAGL
ncbi:Na+/H+ antiporter NhaC family protein [Agrococcus versicolor]|uniref:Na+/H+ antiporter NhaC family protein n=1 Tax=Agrococcus versicolor TaxID=501482 RepID=A0ABP5ME45_9MICO